MKQIKTTHVLIIAFIVSINVFFIGTALAAVKKCPLKIYSAYKYNGNNAVFYITKTCTRQVFLDPESFFKYFKSWKQVNKTIKKTLDKIPKDKNYLITLKKTATILPSPVSPSQQAPTCYSDVWSCGDWSPCWSSGQQVRTCTLISRGCSNATREQPIEYRSCLPASQSTSSTLSTTPNTQQSTSNQSPAGVVAKYLTCPTEEDIQTLNRDFSLTFMAQTDTAADDNRYLQTNWNNLPYSCNRSDQTPSRAKIYNTLRFLRDIKFSRPLPFTGGLSLYDFLKLKSVSSTIVAVSSGTLHIEPLMECNVSSRGFPDVRLNAQGIPYYAAFNVILNGSLAYWQPIASQSNPCTIINSSATEPSVLAGNISNPIFSGSLVVHEAYHAIAAKYHTVPNGNDATIDEMGAWAAQFYFDAWVDLYATNVDQNTKALGKTEAINLLNTRFSEQKCPTDPTLKNVVNQISPGTCQ
ncbi:MAG: hypothetical protein HYV42_05490 [Candidatus Magasanikbacteria bacterium]|nr:hypothetical protein [Candidatus Magasanikbacteria bacterium]